MSFSAGARANTKAALLADLFTKLDAVVVSQPAHAADIPFVKKVAEGYVALLPDAFPEDAPKDYVISVSGNLSWTYVPEAPPSAWTAAGLSCSVHLATPVANPQA